MNIEDEICERCKQLANAFIAVDKKVVNGHLEFKAVCYTCYKLYYNNGNKIP